MLDWDPKPPRQHHNKCFYLKGFTSWEDSCSSYNSKKWHLNWIQYRKEDKELYLKSAQILRILL